MRIATPGVVGVILLLAGSASAQNVIRLGESNPAPSSTVQTLKLDGDAETQQIFWGRRWGCRCYPGYGYGYGGYGYPVYAYGGYGYVYGYGYPAYGYGGYGYGAYPGYGYGYRPGYVYGGYPGYGYWGISDDGQTSAAVMPIDLRTQSQTAPAVKQADYTYRAYGE
jgi:hypothetical protein